MRWDESNSGRCRLPAMSSFDLEQTLRHKLLRMGVLLRLVCLFAVSVCGVLSLVAHAQDPDVVKAPYIEVGDCWTYAVKGFFRRGWIDSYRECVTYIDTQKNLVICVATLRPTGEEVETAYTLTWGTIADVGGHVNKPPVEIRFPLRVAETYELTNEYYDTPNGESAAGRVTRKVTVVGWEDVTVPAGRFRALRIETVGRWESKPGGTGPVKTTFWYAPAANRTVKSIFDSAGSGPPQHREGDLLAIELKP